MDIRDNIDRLYSKDTSNTYALLRELEALSDREDALYPYVDTFLAMTGDDRYVVRVRGFRLLCRQARWDDGNRLDAAVDVMRRAVCDEKPTAVRQALEALAYVVPYKPALRAAIRDIALSIDLSRFKDTMRPLIEKDVARLVALIDNS